jgi:hypothetical protein
MRRLTCARPQIYTFNRPTALELSEPADLSAAPNSRVEIEMRGRRQPTSRWSLRRLRQSDGGCSLMLSL